MSPSRLTSVVLPVYNEDDNIQTCLRGLGSALREIEHEILVVYDFDEDTTLPAIEAMADRPPSVRLVKNEIGRGALNALRAGFQAARGDVVVTTMADLSDPPERIPALAEKVRAGADVVAGSRYVRGGSQTGGPLLKRTMSRTAGLLLHWIAGLGTHDATSNFRAYSKRFLDEVTVESSGGFEVALELTVKAHLMGRKVDEVPSSWTDRSAGESRFQLWNWLPHYLKWFLKAALAPTIAWVVLAGLALLALGGLVAGPERTIDVARIAASTALGAGAILLARTWRGRNVPLDVLHGVLWVPPAFTSVHGAIGLLPAWLGAAVISLGAIALTLTPERRATAWSSTRAAGKAVFRQSTLGYLLLGLGLWLSHAAAPGDSAADDLDAGWEQVLGYGLVHGFQWGKDLVFTFGPLGYFNRGRFDPELFWTKVVWWEFAFKAVVVAFTMTTFARIRGALSKTLFYLAVLLPMSGHDTFWFLGIACVALWCLERDDRSNLLVTVGLASIALMGLVKFTVFVYAGFAVFLIAAVRARRRTLIDGLGVLAIYGASVLVIWFLCGQELSSLPAFLKHSYWIAKHYTAGQSDIGPGKDLVLGGVTFALCALVAGLFVVVRPWRLEKLAAAGLVLGVLYFAGKSGFTRHGINAIRFFTVSAAVPFLFFPPRGSDEDAAWRIPGQGLRNALCWVIFGLSIYGYHSVLEHGRHSLHRLFGDKTARVTNTVEDFLDLDALFEERAAERARLQVMLGLPRLRDAIGDGTVDLIHNSQGVVFLNELNYRPRPIFQSYQVNSPDLLAMNREFYEGDRAPEYVLFDFDTTDKRFPNMEDNEVHQVLMRDYAPVDFEREILLLQRRPDAPRGDAPTVVEERTFGFGERVDVPPVGPDEALWIELEFEDTSLGKLGTTLLKTPPLHAVCTDAAGIEYRFRIVAGITPSGLLMQPFPIHAKHWARWFAGDQTLTRITSFAVEGGEWVERWWAPEIHARFVRRTPDVGDAKPEFFKRVSYSMLTTPPDSAEGEPQPQRGEIRGVEVLKVATPSELCWELEPGRYDVTGQFGVDPRAALDESFPGVRFRVLLRAQDGREGVIFRKDLNPRAEPIDGRLQRFDQTVETRDPITLVLSTASRTPEVLSNPAGAYWIRVKVAPAGDEDVDEPGR